MDTQLNRLNLAEVEGLLLENKILISPEDDRNPIDIASSLGLIGLQEIERVESGYFDRVDQRRMLTGGLLIRPIAFGQRVLQAVQRTIDHE